MAVADADLPAVVLSKNEELRECLKQAADWGLTLRFRHQRMDDVTIMKIIVRFKTRSLDIPAIAKLLSALLGSATGNVGKSTKEMQAIRETLRGIQLAIWSDPSRTGDCEQRIRRI